MTGSSWRARVAGWVGVAGAAALTPPTWAVVRPDLSASGFVLVAPSQPRPQEPFRVAFSYAAASGGYGSTPEIQLGDANVDIFLADPCAEPGAQCGSRRVLALSVNLPGVDSGDYVVRVFAGRDDRSALVQLGGFKVASGFGGRSQPLPAEGYWAGPTQPGSGFFLDHQGPIWAAGFFNYLPPATLGEITAPNWQLAVGELKRDALLLPLNHYPSGHCYGCPGYAPPMPPDSVGMARFRSESARRGWLSVNGGVELPVAAIAFGANYVNADLIDGGDPVFGQLSLPDLQGEWLLADDLGASRRLRFDTPPELVSTNDVGVTVVLFRGTSIGTQEADLALSCQHGVVSHPGGGGTSRPALCVLSIGSGAGPGGRAILGEFELANIEERRMQGHLVRTDNSTASVVAYRIRGPEALP